MVEREEDKVIERRRIGKSVWILQIFQRGNIGQAAKSKQEDCMIVLEGRTPLAIKSIVHE